MTRPIARTSRSHRGAARCCARPAMGAVIQAACSVAGIRRANRKVVSVVTNSAKTNVRRAVLRSACTRGGSSSCAAWASTSPPPIAGRTRQRPVRQVSPASRYQRSVGTGAGSETSGARGGAVRTALTTLHRAVSTSTPTPIQTPRAIVSDRRSNPTRARIHSSPTITTASIVAKSSGLRRPVSRSPAMAVTATPDA